MTAGRLFFESYWQPGFSNILDIGSRDVNGTLRSVKPAHAGYLGVDMQAGPGVDLVVDDPHALPFAEQSFHVVVSTSCLEHDPMFWLTFAEMVRVVKAGGLIYINAPSNGLYHGYPFDHWRFYPDSGKALEQWAGKCGTPVELIESFIGQRDNDIWSDNVMVFARKPFATRLPKKLVCDRIAGATNIRRRGGRELEKFQEHPEDLRELKQAKARIETLCNELLQRSDGGTGKALPRHPSVPRTEFQTAFPAGFLGAYQTGVMRYSYRGVSCFKSPIDLALYTKAIWDLQPGSIIEIGSAHGGSALWLADLTRSYGLQCPIVSIDVEPPTGVDDARIRFLQGDVNALSAVFQEHNLSTLPRPWLVIEDSAHTYQTCKAALRQLSGLMQAGDLLVMEDGVLDELGWSEKYDGGPNRAVNEWLSGQHPGFTVDRTLCDLFGRNATYAPNAWLRKH